MASIIQDAHLLNLLLLRYVMNHYVIVRKLVDCICLFMWTQEAVKPEIFLFIFDNTFLCCD